MNKIRYTIVAFASSNIQSLLSEFREQFDIPFSVNSENRRYTLKDVAHIAIKRTFVLKQNKKEEELVKKFSELSDRDNIPVRCSESGVFTATAYGEVIYAKVDYNAQLEKLHFDIKKKIDDMIETKNLATEGAGYIPHITLAYNLPKEKVAEAQQYINAKIIPCDFRIQKIVLLRDYDVEKDERETVTIFDLEVGS